VHRSPRRQRLRRRLRVFRGRVVLGLDRRGVRGAIDVGMPSSFSLNQPVYVASKNVFIVRDASGLYALTARCTHQGVTVDARTTEFYCTGHGATFNFNGDVTHGPATTPLQHYAMCMLSNGHVGVDTSMPVAKTVRLVV
jgi:nitrite reductase/ring-hydroxylating ferredoxin subunit